MTRIERITDMIETYATDSHLEGYDRGYDEAWDEARDKGFDEGYIAGIQYTIERLLEDYVDETNFVVTPVSHPELQDMLKDHYTNGPMCVMLYMNWLTSRLRDGYKDKSL